MPYDEVKRALRKARLSEQPLECWVARITPDLAQELLRQNENIRSIKQPVAMKYTADMLLDRWPLTGEPLIFDRDGKLRNGQHRLTACIRSDRPFVTLVVLGVEAE